MRRTSHFRDMRRRPAAISAATSSGKSPDFSNGGGMNHKVAGSGPPAGSGSYAKPRLERLGTFRELTQAGGASFSDMWTTDSNEGCVIRGSSTYVCYGK